MYVHYVWVYICNKYNKQNNTEYCLKSLCKTMRENSVKAGLFSLNRQQYTVYSYTPIGQLDYSYYNFVFVELCGIFSKRRHSLFLYTYNDIIVDSVSCLYTCTCLFLYGSIVILYYRHICSTLYKFIYELWSNHKLTKLFCIVIWTNNIFFLKIQFNEIIEYFLK